jgi:hypothetical protein
MVALAGKTLIAVILQASVIGLFPATTDGGEIKQA